MLKQSLKTGTHSPEQLPRAILQIDAGTPNPAGDVGGF